MKRLRLNPDYLRRHLFAAAVMAALGCWFGYDGAVRYPRMAPDELYRSIEQAEPPADTDLEAFKRQKTNAQLGLALVLLVAAGVVGLRLFLSSRLDFAWDEAGFSVAGRRHSPADVASLDRSRWESKGILKLKLADGGSVVLDAWHHLGVREAAAELFPLPDETKKEG